ncbi:MAG: ribosome assembly RNA-binding protein YhbY [Lachnospiraceae bacterium]|nr:ribosome assembly RNA-binding protein YhbY [Lachnospiraceae bacterium]
MTSKQRAYLRKLANDLDPVIRIGKDSITPELVMAVDEAFNNRELIKIQVLKNCFDEPYDLADTLADRTRSQVVQVIGKRIVLYKADPKDPKIVLPK